jgi:ankyrin repeat protein
LPIIRELMLLGADATGLDKLDQTAEDLATKAMLPEVAQVLSAVESPSSKLTRAVVAQDADAVRAQLEDMKTQGSLTATINGKGRDGMSALHHAGKIGFLPVIDLLLQYEAHVLDVDVQKGADALWFTTRYSHSNGSAFLCRKGASPTARAKDGSSALHNACYNGMTAIVETLLADHKLLTSWTDKDGLTALDLACMQGHLSTIKTFIISRPACVGEVNDAGESPLFAALRCKAPKAIDICKLLVDEECDAKKLNTEGKSVLDAARAQGQASHPIIDYLSSLLNVGAGYIAEDGMAAGETQQRPRRPRISISVTDPRLDATRLASARLALQLQQNEAQAKIEELQVQRQEALSRREADKTRQQLRQHLIHEYAGRNSQKSALTSIHMVSF